ncbi:receptor-like protein EIX1 [Coffea eugenioides]|uniref:receptor-like protein EIX1 n=1 Tax=Coffea eugenioides TaxID=49369 RepID=UPI000F60D90D|nr:receptor-like protein EIX1 [Coffea eugenioides]
MMEGIVTQSQFENLTNLRYLKAPGNSLTLEVDPSWVSLAQFLCLDLSSWKLGPQFPNWLRLQKKINYLDLSSTGISGAIPPWLWNMSTAFDYLDLSHNQLSGGISNICCINKVHLSSNQFTGPLPSTTPDRMFTLDLSNNSISGGLSHFQCHGVRPNGKSTIEVLDLGENLLSGKIPDCWMNWTVLGFISLSNNNLSGSIPMSIGYLSTLLSLHLGNNNLSGGIPSSLDNCTELITIDVAGNKLGGKLPTWLGPSLSKLRILILRSNKFHGEIPPELCHLSSLRALDVSNNDFVGVIPSCFKNFTSMATEESVYLRNNETTYFYSGYPESAQLAIKGNVYEYNWILGLFCSIDLSNNNFSGKIPLELTNLLGLKSLNLSGNQLEE